MRVPNIWPWLLDQLQERGARDHSEITPEPQVVVEAHRLLRYQLVARIVALTGANLPTALASKPGEPEIVYGLAIRAGPQPDGLTPNTSTLWLGGAQLVVNADGTIDFGVPMLPNEERSWDDLTQLDLSELFVLSVTASDVARLSYLVPV